MRAALERSTAIWAILGGLILLAIVGVTVTNVAAFGLDRIARLSGRTVSGLSGYEDFVRLAVAAAIPMFLPYCQMQRGHLAVDLFLKRAPRWFNWIIDTLSLILMASAALFLAYWMVLGMIETRADGALSRVLGWHEWPFYLAGIASLILWAIVAIAQLFFEDTQADARTPDRLLHG